ncbi:MAG: hypothetical protein AAGH17_00595 [Pseudomonadota bacterium]
MSRSFNTQFMIAGIMFLATAAIHALAGGPEINAPVQASTLDPVVRSVMAVVWHAITAVALVLAAAMIWTARHRNPAVILLTLAINVSFIALFWAIGIAELGSLLLMPQWIIFATISLVMLWGLKRETARG